MLTFFRWGGGELISSLSYDIVTCMFVKIVIKNIYVFINDIRNCSCYLQLETRSEMLKLLLL